jgi:hypothetical protein
MDTSALDIVRQFRLSLDLMHSVTYSHLSGYGTRLRPLVDRPGCRLSSRLSKTLSESRALGIKEYLSPMVTYYPPFVQKGKGGFLRLHGDIGLIRTHGLQRCRRPSSSCWARMSEKPSCLRKKNAKALSFSVCSGLFHAFIQPVGKEKRILPGIDDGGHL